MPKDKKDDTPQKGSMPRDQKRREFQIAREKEGQWKANSKGSGVRRGHQKGKRDLGGEFYRMVSTQ